MVKDIMIQVNIHRMYAERKEVEELILSPPQYGNNNYNHEGDKMK